MTSIGSLYSSGVSRVAISTGSGSRVENREDCKNCNEDAAKVEISDDAKARAESDRVEQNSEDSTGLTDEEQEEIRKLKARDREVRAHEQAHLSALGRYKKGGASFDYQTGPDGRRYAVGGEVPVDVSPEKTPDETIKKAQTIRRAALAPAEPSGADRSVAAQATQMESQARAEKASPEQSNEPAENISGAKAAEGVNTAPSANNSVPTIQNTVSPVETSPVATAQQNNSSSNAIKPVALKLPVNIAIARYSS